MKNFLRPPVLSGGVMLLLGLLLAEPAALVAQSSRRHRRTPPPAEDAAEQASPSPSALPASTRQGRRKTDNASPTPSPTPTSSTAPGEKTESEKAAADKSKPSSADEAAPSQAKSDAATAATSEGGDPRRAAGAAAVSSIEPSELENFDALPEPVRQLLSTALDLTKRNLTYAYGSADPSAGGMDCSGTIYHLLKARGFEDVPRQANEQYSWVRRKSRFYAVLGKKQETTELAELRPGDLLFWTGTYNVDREPPVTHVMVYLGRRKKDGHRLMFGSSDGRPYDGQRRNGVSVFDFRLPSAKHGDAADVATTASPDRTPDFSGYGPIPGITDLNDAASRQTVSAHAGPPSTNAKEKDTTASNDEPAATPKPKRNRSRSRSGS